MMQMLIVTGGWNGEVLGSTEVLGYTSYLENEGRGEWRQVKQTSDLFVLRLEKP